MMDLVFCGTPLFAVPTLEKLVAAGFRVKLVVTQPDRPSGRGMEPAASPVKRAALELDLPILQPEKIKNNEEFRRQLAEIAPEAIIVVGYGRIIPQWMIDLPPFGNINLHGSLLPKYRGAAPIQWAIAMGESITGVTTMRIDAGLDTGDILQQAEERINPEDTAVTLAPRLAQTGAELMISTLAGLKNGTSLRGRKMIRRRRSRRSLNAKMGSSTSRTRRRMPGTVCADFSPGRARLRSFAARSCSFMPPRPLPRWLWLLRVISPSRTIVC